MDRGDADREQPGRVRPGWGTSEVLARPPQMSVDPQGAAAVHHYCYCGGGPLALSRVAPKLKPGFGMYLGSLSLMRIAQSS